MLRELPKGRADAVLEAMGDSAEDVESLLDYAEGTAGADLEGHVARVDGVGLAVVDHHLDARDGGLDQHALGQRLLEALVTRRDVLAGDRAASCRRRG